MRFRYQEGNCLIYILGIESKCRRAFCNNISCIITDLVTWWSNHLWRNLGRTVITPGLNSSKRYPFSLRKLLTAVGSAACPRLWLPLPVMISKDAGLCVDDAFCWSNFSLSLQLNDSSDEERIILFSILTLFGDTEQFDSSFVSICCRCSCKAWIASDAWRPCKSNFHKSFLLFLILKISLAAFLLRLSATNRSSRAFFECCWAEKWSPLTKAWVAALECCDADLFI